MATLLTIRLVGADRELLSALILIGPLFVFAELAPKNIFRRAADAILYPITPAIVFFKRVLWPLTAVLQGLGNLVLLPIGGIATGPTPPPWTQERLRYFLTEGRASGMLTEYQHTIADNIMKLKGIRVEKVMIPIEKVQMIRATLTRPQVLEAMRASIHSRLPVCDDRGQVVGIIHILDLFDEWPDAIIAEDAARPAITFREGTTVVDALFTLQKRRQTMGIVVNQAGNTIGILTVKDLVEEIVGEIKVW
jgi:CBS domain containing-hemolysin-like protein